MDIEEYETMKCEVKVTLPSPTPVVGCEINPIVRLRCDGSFQAPQHSLNFSWLREQTTCSVHHLQRATIQCMSCLTLKIPVKESYHCSTKCFLDAWQKHLVHHNHAAETLRKNSNCDGQALGKLRSCGSWPAFGNCSSYDDHAIAVAREGKAWIKVGSSKNYVPSMDDFGCILRLESMAIECSTGISLSPINITLTDPVITAPKLCPRSMIHIGHLKKYRNVNFDVQYSNAGSFSVLSYNILSDLYASGETHCYCPAWALAWEYRRQNLLHEIIGYDADILCLQEVQSDHFENFFKPEMAKHGYSVIYKKKTKEVYTSNQYIIDGCATFFRHDRFKEIMKYELEFDRMALPLVEALEPAHRIQGSIRLLKDNVALVVILETVANGIGHDAFQFRICVANTHIHANSNFPDVKLCQVANLINGLENIVQSQIPLLVCGDINSLPGRYWVQQHGYFFAFQLYWESCSPLSSWQSNVFFHCLAVDPHNFIVTGRINSVCKKNTTDPLGIYQHLKLHHSMPLVSAYSCLLESGVVGEQQKKKMNPQTREPLFTNFRRGFSGTLDYIFYTADSLEVEGLLELLDNESAGVALPSPLWSSDHIALMANFRIKPASCHGLCSSHPPSPWQQAAPE